MRPLYDAGSAAAGASAVVLAPAGLSDLMY
jgi:hypothetical protein